MATAPLAYPFGVPTVSGALVTVDSALNAPTKINRALSDLTLRKYFAPRVFTNGGGVSGGAVEYFQLTNNDLFPLTDVQNVEPGAEFPLVTFDRPVPLVAQVEKIGGKFFVTDEARRRNDPSLLQAGIQKIANAITRQGEQKAIALLDASIAATGAAVQYASPNNWSTIITGGSSASNNSAYPAADFAAVQLKAEQTELGVEYNLWLVNPQELMNFQIVYGNAWREVLASWNIEMVATNRVAAGTAYAVAEGQVGQILIEKGLSTEVYREEATQRTWVQSDVAFAMVVTNPYNAVKITSLAS